MRGFPKTLSSKEDYLYIKSNFPDQWKEHWQALLDTRFGWYPVKEVASIDAGVNDDTHKVVEIDNLNGGEKTFMQYELKQNPQCKLLRLGFTVKEVQKALA